MTDVEATYDDFMASRRSGRRNAVQDIPGGPGVQGVGDLSQTLAQLSVNKSGDGEEDSDKGQVGSAKEEETRAE